MGGADTLGTGTDRIPGATGIDGFEVILLPWGGKVLVIGVGVGGITAGLREGVADIDGLNIFGVGCILLLPVLTVLLTPIESEEG